MYRKGISSDYLFCILLTVEMLMLEVCLDCGHAIICSILALQKLWDFYKGNCLLLVKFLVVKILETDHVQVIERF